MIDRLLLSAIGSLWLLTGFASLHVVMTTPPDPDVPPSSEFDVAGFLMFVWCSVVLVLLGPLALGASIEHRDKRREKILAASKRQPPPWRVE